MHLGKGLLVKDQITSAELKLMRILWKKAPLGAAEIAREVEPSTQWSVKTVKTLLSRLVEKGALAHEQEGRRYLYRPTISQKSYSTDAAMSFIDKLFGGRAAPMVAHLADGDGLSKDDIEELEALVEELKRDRK